MKILLNLLISATLAIGVLTSPVIVAQDAVCNQPAPVPPNTTTACDNAGVGIVHLRYGRFGNDPETGITEWRINPPTIRMNRGQGHNQKKLVIKLKVIGDDTSFDDRTVTVSSDNNLWLSGSATASDAKKQIEICIPDACAGNGSQYKYEVHIPGLGILDPRVKVQN